jgi:PAS domain S-box-containing protein
VLNLRKDGTTFWCNATVSTFDHPQYGPVWVSVQTDITAQKQAEDALRHREHDFSTLVENSTDMIVRFDAAMRYIYCNPAVERQLGIPFHQLLGKSPLESGTSVEQSRFIVTSLQKTLETGMEQEVEQPVPTPSGLRHFLTRIVPERDDDGSIVSLLAITRDITERKLNEDDFRQKTYQQLQASFETLQKTEANLRLHQTELEVQNEELRQVQLSLEVSRQRYFELYDLAPAGYLALSGQGLILHANLTAATLLGVERHQLEEKPFTRYIVPDDQDIFYHCRKKLVETKKRQSCELHMLHELVTPFRVQIIAAPAPAGEGDESSISLMMIDIPGPETEKETLAGERIPCR